MDLRRMVVKQSWAEPRASTPPRPGVVAESCRNPLGVVRERIVSLEGQGMRIEMGAHRGKERLGYLVEDGCASQRVTQCRWPSG